jgi:carbon storage regulator CsrA
MLILTRRTGEKIIIIPNPDKPEERIVITALSKLRVGFDAPREINIVREELIQNSEETNNG